MPTFRAQKTPLVSVNPGGDITAVVAVPPVADFYFTRHRFSGLGPEIVSTLLGKNGCKVQVFNFPAQCKKGRKLPLPEAFNHLKPHIIENEVGGGAWFTRFQAFGPPLVTCADQMIAAGPDIVFIACFAFCYADTALALAAAFREKAPEIPIVVGGAGASAYPEFFLRHPSVDYVLAGEAEISIPEFIRALKNSPENLSRVPNLYYNDGADTLAPFEKRHTRADETRFVLKKTHETPKTLYFSTSLSRGCIKKCRFCANFLCHGRAFRVIPIDTIKKALAEFPLPADAFHKTVHVNFEDDNLLLAPDYFLDVLSAFRNKFPQARFLAENGLDYTRMTPALVGRLIRNGITQFNLSIASTHDFILEKQARKAELPLYEQMVRMLCQAKIRCITYFICGFKDDTPRTVAENIAFLAKQPTLIGISLFYPVPGIYDFTDKTRFDAGPPGLCAGSAAWPWNGSLTTAQMITAFRLCRFVNLLKSTARTPAEAALVQKIMDTRRLHTLVRENKTHTIVPVPEADIPMVNLFFDQFPGAFTVLPYEF